MISEIAMKTCTGGCGRTLPATTEYFYKSKVNRDRLYGWCRDCRYRYDQDKTSDEKRCLGECGQTLPNTLEYFEHSVKGKTLRNKCRICRDQEKGDGRKSVETTYLSTDMLARRLRKERGVIIRDIHNGVLQATRANEGHYGKYRISVEEAERYMAIVKSRHLAGTPDLCGACGTATGNIVGDVDERTKKQYGYLCFRCYKVVSAFHADSDRMSKVLHYVEKTRKGKPV